MCIFQFVKALETFLWLDPCPGVDGQEYSRPHGGATAGQLQQETHAGFK